MTHSVSVARTELEANPLTVYALGDQTSVVVGPDGAQWRIGAAASSLVGPEGREVLHSIARDAPEVAAPIVDRDDTVAGSGTQVLAAGLRVDTTDPAQPTCVVWPFAGHWHRLQLQPGRALELAKAAVRCLQATVPDGELAHALTQPALKPGPPPTVGAERVDPPASGTLLRWHDGAWHEHPVDPVPLVDPVTGVLRRVVARPPLDDMPPGFLHLHAELPHMASIDPTFQPDALAPAGALTDGSRGASPEVIEPALLQGVSHYCGAYMGQGERRYTSAAVLEDEGAQYVSVSQWQPHDPLLHLQPGFPFRRFTSRDNCWWIAGTETGARCWVPLSLVHAGWMQSGLPGLIPHNFHNLAGLQAGRTYREAVTNAAAHVVAHDAVAVWWHSTALLAEVPVPERVQRAWGDSPLSLRLLAVPSTTGIPVRLAVVDDAKRDIVSLGFAAHAEGARAAELATVEALIQHASARDLASPSSLIRRAEEVGNGGVAGLAPYDSERRYRDAFGDHFRGLIDPMGHVQLGLDPSIVEYTRRRTIPDHRASDDASTSAVAPVTSVTAETFATPDEPPKGRSMTDALLRRGHRVITVDVTTPRARSAGMFASRVIIPGMARLQPAAFPLDPHGRVERAANSLGWECAAPLPYPGW